MAEIFYAYHVVTERPMQLGQHILFDDTHHSGVYERVMGRPTFQIVKVKVTGNRFMGDATKCFDGVTSKEQNLSMAEKYWENGPNPPQEPPIHEFLVSGDIEVVEIVKEISCLSKQND